MRRTLGTLTENGVTLLRALELLEEISGNEFIRQRMVSVRNAVVDGATLSVALANEKIFPELYVDMMSVGEQTGKFGDTMQMIAQVYEREFDKQVKIISSLIPPMIMVVIATVVGFVVFGILAAVFGMTSNLQPGGRSGKTPRPIPGRLCLPRLHEFRHLADLRAPSDFCGACAGASSAADPVFGVGGFSIRRLVPCPEAGAPDLARIRAKGAQPANTNAPVKTTFRIRLRRVGD